MITAWAPRAATSTEIARPSPVEAPVTSTIQPSKSLPAIGGHSLICLAGLIARRATLVPAKRAAYMHGHAGKPSHPAGSRAAEIPDSPEQAVLERVPNPQADTLYLARFVAPEFTSLCPVTGQPDFAHLVIDYAPADWLIESKSLKLYLSSFRNHGAFHEDCTVAIGRKIVEIAQPRWLRIGGYWYPRGGIPIDVFWQSGVAPEGLWIPDQGVAPYRGRG